MYGAQEHTPFQVTLKSYKYLITPKCNMVYYKLCRDLFCTLPSLMQDYEV